MLLLTVSLTLLVVCLLWWGSGWRAPSLGHHHGVLTPLSGKPNAVSSQTDIPALRVEPWPLLVDLATSRNALMTVLQREPRVQIRVATETYIHAVFISRIWRFRDDVEWVFDTTHQRVEYRSASRLGYADWGVNRQRYEALKQAYLSELQAPDN